MEIILKPILTEKMSALTDKEHKVAFVVAKDANKIEIKKAHLPPAADPAGCRPVRSR